ncbi:unnamed protein product [Cunninghamella blakesleeana]
MLSYSHHLDLLNIPWTLFESKTNDVYYIKAQYDNTAYKVLITDLKHVWYEYGDANSIMKRAEESYRMEIESEEQIITLLSSLRNCFKQSKNCSLTLTEDKLLIEYNEYLKGFISLSWSFHCLPLGISMNKKNHDLDGPTVLYIHFILPMLMVTQSASMKNNEKELMTEKDLLKNFDCFDKLLEANQQLLDKKEITKNKDENGENGTNSAKSDHHYQKNNKNNEQQQTMTSNGNEKITDLENELKRREELNMYLLKKREQGKKKKRLF